MSIEEKYDKLVKALHLVRERVSFPAHSAAREEAGVMGGKPRKKPGVLWASRDGGRPAVEFWRAKPERSPCGVWTERAGGLSVMDVRDGTLPLDIRSDSPRRGRVTVELLEDDDAA